MKKIGKLLLLAAGVGCLLMPTTNEIKPVIHKKSAPTVFNQYDKLVQGVNITNSTEVSYKQPAIFDQNSLDFQNACDVRHIPNTDSNYFSSSSAHECSKMYSTIFNGNLSLAVDTPSVSLDIDGKFKKADMTQTFKSKEENYEYFYWLAQKYIVNIDWYNSSIKNAFTERFTRELGQIKTLQEAGNFLNSFGSHVFSNYILGGKMEITKYFCKDANYELTSTEKDLTVGLNAIVSRGKVEGQLNSSVDFSKFETDSNRNQNVYSKMTFHSYGGTTCSALTPADLFQFKPQFGNGVQSGFLYENWTNQFANNDNAQVIPVSFDGAVAIWDIIDNKIYSSQIPLLKKAFDLMLYKNYAKGCENFELDCGYIDSLTYADAGSEVTLKPSSQTMYLPQDTDVTINISDFVKSDYQDDEYSLNLSNDIFATIKNNVITTKKVVSNAPFFIELYLQNELVYRIPIVIKESRFNGGYGTEKQPFLINSKEAFVDLLNDFVDSEGNKYKLTSDIDLNGEFLVPGGFSTASAFKGILDGNNCKIKNGNILCKTFSNGFYDCGLIARNEGIIQNLILDNMKSYIDGVVVSSATGVSINHGILTGCNYGTISNCRIYNSALRSTCKINDNASSYSVGLIAGESVGQINNSAVCNNRVVSTVLDNTNAKVHTGAIVGLLNGGSIIYSYSMKNSINAFVPNAFLNHIGGVFGFATSIKLKQSDDTEIIRYSLIENSISGDNNLGDGARFGYIGGDCENTIINNCYHNGLDNKSINNKKFNGCNQIESLKLSKISSLDIQNKYMEKNKILILKIHNED